MWATVGLHRFMSCWIVRWRRLTVAIGWQRRRWPIRCSRSVRATSRPRNLLTAPGDAGEIRRLTILFADLVDSTVLSTRVEPETYRMLMGATAIRCKESDFYLATDRPPLYRSSSGVGSLRPVLTRY